MLCRGFFAGALAVVAVILLLNGLYGLSLTVQQGWLPVLLGGLAGLHVGRTALRLSVTTHRSEESEKLETRSSSKADHFILPLAVLIKCKPEVL